MSIDLDQKTELLIQQELETERLPDAASLVDAALRHYVLLRQLNEDYTRTEVEAKIARGIASLERGEGIDGEVFMSQLTSELDNMERTDRE